MSENKYTQTIYSSDGESSIFAGSSGDRMASVAVTSGYGYAIIELDKDSIIEFAESLIKMAGEL